jgi:dTDP-glucose pyrophosphorylase
MKDWQQVAVSAETPLGEAIGRIDESGSQIALVVDEGQRLIGLLTDGDIRRAILRGEALSVPVAEVMNLNPTVAPADIPREQILALMRRHVIHHLPLVDQNRRVVQLVTLDDLIGAVERPNWVVLMAGGLGTRLRPLTKDCPKPMLPVGGKPILESILESFVEQGFRHFFLSVNFKAEMVQDHFGDGSRWGVSIDYLLEDRRLGTAGPLSLLDRRPDAPLVVMNGDLLTRISFDKLMNFHNAQSAVATMAVREYDFQVPYGVVEHNESRVVSINEKPVHKFFVSAGIYVLAPSVLDLVPSGMFLDMPNLLSNLIKDRQTVAAYPLREYWLDIGRIEEFERAQQEWRD